MKMNPEVDAYIAAYPPKVRALMKTIRATVHKALPDGEEKISYGLVGYFRDGAVAYFSAFKSHIGFFPPTDDPKLQKATAKFANAKGNLKFPLNALPPYDIISKLVTTRAAANRKKAEAAKKAEKKSAKKAAKKKTAKKKPAKKK
ncbi:MAG: iron chaperone [Rhodospirillaceae bacterium]